MNFRKFLKDKLLQISLILFGIITIEIFLIPLKIGITIKLYIPVVIIVAYMIGFLIEYFAKRNFYNNIYGRTNTKKHLRTSRQINE